MSKKPEIIKYHNHTLRSKEVEALKKIGAQINEKIRLTEKNNRVISLDLARTDITNIKPLHSLRSLQTLDLKVTSVADLTPLQNLKDLQSLNISKTNVTNLTPLKHLLSLQKLTIGFTPIDNFDSLKHLKNLRYLNLFHVELSNLLFLTPLANLRELFIPYNPVSDLQPISKLESLETLDLAETSVSNLEPLKKLRNLQKLSLYNTPVKDIFPLLDLHSLRELDLRNTKISRHNEVAQTLKERGVKIKGLGRFSQCYITTAVCQNTNIRNTGYILNTFRNWRDTYMKKTEKRRTLVREYYQKAPKLVKKIRKTAIERKIYSQLLDKYILPALHCIEQGKNYKVFQIYKQALKFTQKILRKYKLH